jgi:membrane-associated phospholipid phosphatase
LTKSLHLLSFFGEGSVYFIGFLLILNWYSKGRAFFYLLFLSTMLTLQNVGKIGYHEPRPYMVWGDLTAIGCSHEYGQPSGHSLFSAGFAMFVFLDFTGRV